MSDFRAEVPDIDLGYDGTNLVHTLRSDYPHLLYIGALLSDLSYVGPVHMSQLFITRIQSILYDDSEVFNQLGNQVHV